MNFGNVTKILHFLLILKWYLIDTASSTALVTFVQIESI